MTNKTLNGDRALAWGALHSGVSLVTGYPGSPSSGTLETLIGLAPENGIYIEWSSNERVALEMGIGASIAGRRTLVCTKSVGLNVMIDPLMALNLTPVHGGLVILLGDDPGGYGSQNDQDSRPLVAAVEMPLLEPSSPAEAYAMIQEAFDLSERAQTPVFIRETRSFTQQKESIELSSTSVPKQDKGMVREPWRFVPVPKNAVEKHRTLHDTIETLRIWAEQSLYTSTIGIGRQGLIAAGFAYAKLIDVLGTEIEEHYHILKLNVLFPLPKQKILEFLRGCKEILVFEENEPFVETHIKAIAQEADCSTQIYGKESKHITREGELFRWQIQEALAAFLPNFAPSTLYSRENEAEERPMKKDHCVDCHYDKILDSLEKAAESLGQKPVLVGDPGCLVTVADRLDAKYAIGSAVGVADGLSKAGIEERAVAIFGDSAFFHSSLPAICNAVHNRSNIMMVVLDNQATATSGFQTNPGVGRDAFGNEAPALDIESIARACGVISVYACGPHDLDDKLVDTFQEALSQKHLTLCIVRLDSK